MNPVKRGVILLAGGVGSRFGAEKPKQFVELLGRPILDYSLDVFSKESDVVCVVSHPDWIDELYTLPHWREDILIAHGGKTRQESVYSGLQTLAQVSPEVVAIHDGARPLVSPNLIRTGWEKLKEGKAAIPVLPVHQTVAYVHHARISHYIDRTNLVIIQTPQFFHFETIYKAHQKARENGITDTTDDSQLLQKEGISVDIFNGELWNIKITTPEDILLAQTYLQQGEII
ncbi:2-C-methyl-D-erythritol 4-phosphate cytidylyltransferase [Thermospira aquatica]|uniref:2-C-methyl-D-erythritol 4-phosphate cytidylyltransferase n=1 Tax=Thermospira aquatica TaxID=2828656 RepID=A0AAX3BC72_9SPIR|nr:2-C-methyl-D-erythritol 4-phosphate cytidylyltransferase [Thermospira aquatica]URA09860.1 2-C-methyl-D-erythritol 4-phosphate cytidylyltransferase [Thermospira aquatica]